MSLLLQALQKAARNREGPGPEPSTSGMQLELEPSDLGPHVPASTESPRFNDPGSLTQPKRLMSASAASLLSATESSNPTMADYVRERPVGAFMLLALVFAVGYGIYLYLQIFHPQWLRGEFSRPQSIAATAPPPSTLPPPQQIQTPAAPLPYGSPLSPDVPAASPPASPMPSGAGSVQPSSELASLMNLPADPPVEKKPMDPNSRLSALGDALSGSGSPAVPEKRVRKPVEPPPVARIAAKAPTPPRAASARPLPAPATRSGPKPLSAASQPVMELNDQVIVNAAPGAAAPTGPTIADAYRAWKSGKLDQAKAIYQEILENDERNVDALLGSAGVAQQLGNSQEALNYYGRVIEVEPRNSAAQAGIISIAGQADPNTSEARLKQLLAREPSGFLHFSLGNLYARQNQWSQAQQSYFQAYQMDADNSDYAYNLAVGLEHIGQSKLAITYYRKALDLSMKQGRATFNQEQVIDRIAKLSLRAN